MRSISNMLPDDNVIRNPNLYADSYYFSDKVRVNMYEDFQIDFGALDLY